jgi:hypothetical protein
VVATASDDHTGRLWDIRTGKQLYKFRFAPRVSQQRCHPRARDRVQQIVARDHEDPKAIGISGGWPANGT